MSTDYTTLIDRDYQNVAFELLKIVHEPQVWTRRIPKKNVGGYGVEQYIWHAVKDVKDPMVGMDAIDYDYDRALVTPTTQKIPVYWKDIDINPRELASSQRGPIEDVALRSQKSHAFKLIDYVERCFVTGFDVPFTQTAINEDITDSGASAGTWATAANIEVDSRANLGSLLANSMYGPYYNIEWAPLHALTVALVANTGTTYADYINRLFTLGTDITNYQGSTAGVLNTTTGTQTVIQPTAENQQNFELLVAEDWKVHDASTARGNFGLRLKIYGAMTHETFRGEAGAVIDAIALA